MLNESQNNAPITNDIIRSIAGLHAAYPNEGGADLGKRLAELWKPHQINTALAQLTGRDAWKFSEGQEEAVMNAQQLVGVVMNREPEKRYCVECLEVLLSTEKLHCENCLIEFGPDAPDDDPEPVATPTPENIEFEFTSTKTETDGRRNEVDVEITHEIDINFEAFGEYFTHRNISVEGHVDAECVRAAEGVESISADAVADLVAKAQAESERVDREREEAKRSTESAIEAEIAATKAEFPWAKQDGSAHARASANLKMQLQMAFPSVTFSVTSDSYSMGDSVNVRWTDGPSEKQVSEIADHYQYSTYNYHADITESRKHGQGFRSWMGSTRYVSCSRKVSEAVAETVKAAIIAKFGEDGANDWNSGHNASNVLHRSDLRGEFVEIGENEDRETIAIFSRPSLPPASPVTPSTSGAAVAVRENAQKGGIELRFAAKPDHDVISRVKSAGFRWSKFQKMWYAKANERTRAFAYDLAGSEAPAEYQAVQAFDTAVEDSMAAVCFA